jgi:hypothetical protein
MLNVKYFPLLRLFQIWIVGCLVLGATTSANGEGDLVFYETFESPKKSDLYGLLIAKDHLEVVGEKGVDHSRALKTTYVGYERGSKRVTARYRIGERGLEYTLNYDVRFDADFQFVKGGKLHGLGPDVPITGGKTMQPKGWSARVTFKEEGTVKSYVYCQNKDRQYGVSVYAPDFHFEKDRYYAISLHVKLNEDPTEDDGFAHVYIDGKSVIQHDDVQFRADDGEASLISTFLFSTFHGGHEPHWAPRDSQGNYTNVHAYFDNIAVYRGKRVRSKLGE